MRIQIAPRRSKSRGRAAESGCGDNPGRAVLKRWWFTGAWLLFIALIIYLADRHLARSFFSFVQQTAGADKAGHFVLIGGTAFFLNTSLRVRKIPVFGRRLLLGSMIVAAVCTIEEITQMQIPWRTFDYGDLAADYAGILFFGWLGRRLCARSNVLSAECAAARTVSPTDSTAARNAR